MTGSRPVRTKGAPNRDSRVFNPRWFAAGVALGLGLQLAAWVSGIGLFGGLSGYVVMGVLVGWLSPGDTVVQPGAAAFVIAAAGFVLDHLLLSVLGVGIVLAVGYGLVGLVLAVADGWTGERLQSVTR